MARPNVVRGYSIFADAIVAVKVSGEWLPVDRLLGPPGEPATDDDGHNPTVLVGTAIAAAVWTQEHSPPPPIDTGWLLDAPLLRFHRHDGNAMRLYVVPLDRIEAYEIDPERV